MSVSSPGPLVQRTLRSHISGKVRSETEDRVRLTIGRLPLVLFLLFFGRPVLALYGPEFADRGVLALKILVAAQFLGLLCGPNGNVEKRLHGP